MTIETIQPCNLVLTFDADRQVSIPDRCRKLLREIGTLSTELAEIRRVTSRAQGQETGERATRQVVNLIPLGVAGPAEHHYVLKLFHGGQLQGCFHHGPQTLETQVYCPESGTVIRTVNQDAQFWGLAQVLERVRNLGHAVREFMGFLEERTITGGLQANQESVADLDALTDGLYSQRVIEWQKRETRAMIREANLRTTQETARVVAREDARRSPDAQSRVQAVQRVRHVMAAR